MSQQQAEEFLDVWEAEHVEPVPDSKMRQESERLAAACRADAVRAGISIANLESAADRDLVTYMLGALQHPINRDAGWTADEEPF
jgi:hypothetical protein